MATKLRLFTKRVLVFCNILVAIIFLLACLAPYLDPQNWWFISFLGLAFPFLLLVMLVFLIWWLIVKKKYALLSFIPLLLGIPSITHFYSFHIPASFKEKKEPASIRVATWNVARFIEMKRNNNRGSQTRQKMMTLIREQDADIICLQEFFHSTDIGYYANINYIQNNLHYPYYYFSQDDDGYPHLTGSIIFSRFPIIDSGIIRYPRPTLPDALIHADIKVNDDTIRVYTTHLQSLQFGKNDYEKIDQIKGVEDSLLSNSRTIFSKIKRAVINRSTQAYIIGEVLDDSPYPLLFCADLNDVPNSYTYSKVRGNMQDAFLKKGGGIGRTFSSLSPTLRIDYIFAGDNFNILQFKRIVKDYSDHYMLVSDVQLK
ncbi:MAG: endonuclease/exonuclease/phosphatase family protein [Chitinophagaceae bacterium]